jgi:hypothetical protein
MSEHTGTPRLQEIKDRHKLASTRYCQDEYNWYGHYEDDVEFLLTLAEENVQLRKALSVELEHAADIAGGMTGLGNTFEQCQGYSDACRGYFKSLKTTGQGRAGGEAVKVVFLDIDGVLVTARTLKERSGKYKVADNKCIYALNHLTMMTGACIVISSS